MYYFQAFYRVNGHLLLVEGYLLLVDGAFVIGRGVSIDFGTNLRLYAPVIPKMDIFPYFK